MQMMRAETCDEFIENFWMKMPEMNMELFLFLISCSCPLFTLSPKPCTVQLLAVQADTDWVSVLAVRFGEFPHATF